MRQETGKMQGLDSEELPQDCKEACPTKILGNRRRGWRLSLSGPPPWNAPNPPRVRGQIDRASLATAPPRYVRPGQDAHPTSEYDAAMPLAPDLSIVIPAAGSSRRFGRDKLTEILAGRPVIVRTIEAWLSHPAVREIIVPVGDIEQMGELLRQEQIDSHGRVRVCPGGTNRAESVWAGVRQTSGDVTWIAVHDGARPLVSRDLVDRTLDAARLHGAAAAAMPVHLTIKQAAGPLPARVERTVPRNTLWAMQTPQIMRRADILVAFASCPIPLDQVTDDVQLLELAGKEVWLVEGEERNIKITTEMDLVLAERFVTGGKAY